MCSNVTSAPLFGMCPFQLRLLCAANKSNLAQNVTDNVHINLHTFLLEPAAEKIHIVFLLTGTTCTLQSRVRLR